MLMKAGGKQVASYSDLWVEDADRREVPAVFEVQGQTVRIVVEDHKARYPLRVDPLVVFQQKLAASDRAFYDNLGYSVSLSGDSVAVGALGDNYSSGAAYVFALPLTLSNGSPCTSGSICKSTFCVDGVCCDKACGGTVTTDCQACSTAAGAAVNGTCGAASATIVCRTASGECDAAETCDGTTTACPADGVQPTTHACRVAVGGCDVAENCDGSTKVLAPTLD